MKQVQLPPGCRSLQFQDGTRVVAAREGGKVTVSDAHARDIDRMPGNGVAGLVTGNVGQFVTGKKNGRWCKSCSPARLWQPWSTECPKCGAPTESE